MGASKSGSGVEFYPGQKEAIGPAVFGEGGIFSDFLAGKKPNAGFERAQQTGLQQLRQRNSQLGLSQQPLGTRIETDYLTKSNQAAGDNYMSTLFNFMNPAGTTSKSSSAGFWGGKGAFILYWLAGAQVAMDAAQGLIS